VPLHPPRVSLVVKGIAVEDHALVHGDGFLQSSLGVATPLRISDDGGYQSRVVLDSISVLTSTEWHLGVIVPARVRAHTTPQRMLKRARIVLLAAEGVSIRRIGEMVGMETSARNRVSRRDPGVFSAST
jgi:hypothetical protein